MSSSPMATRSGSADDNYHESAVAAASPPPSNRSQRLFTEKDEIRLLKSFRKISKSSDPPASVDPSVLGHLNKALNNKFTDTQIGSKIRHMKEKYRRHARIKSLIKTPHDRKSFALACQIWGKGSSSVARNPQKESTPDDEDEEDEEGEGEAAAEGEEGEEEAQGVDLENFPVLMNEVSHCLAGNGVGEKLLRCLGEKKMMEFNEKWIMLRIEEAKMVAKRAELEKEQLQALLEVTNGN